MHDDRRQVGTDAERAVRHYLEGKGYTYRHSNWRHGHGELDLVMMDGDEVAIIEVKARRSESAGRAEEGVSRKQAGILLRTGEMYSLLNPDVTGRIWRIDLVAVTLDANGHIDDLTHYQNAIVIG